VYTEIDTILQLLGFRQNGSDDESDEQQRGCLFLIVGVLIVGVSAWFASREVRYLWGGELVDATVLRVLDSQGEHPHSTVDFEFKDPRTGDVRRHSAELPLGWRASDGRLQVECVPGADSYARVRGTHQQWSLWVFGASLIACGAYLGWLIREANTPIRRNRRR
jgi:hypothetical protein